ncbi:MAG: serine dehydratase subunit alpha family protein [Clostridia bacterium]|nr:serine dehydratase subunit alpha family protein [Clostridia bacterium]
MDLFSAYTEILREELKPAMGCTEPIAIAYASSILRHAMGRIPSSVRILLSGNIIKNVKSVIVPATGGMHGIEAAVAAGMVSGKPDQQLQVLAALTPSDIPAIKDALQTCAITVAELETDKPFEVRIEGESGKDRVLVHLADRHTHVVGVFRNGEDLTASYQNERVSEEKDHANRALLNVQDIVTYAKEVPLDEVAPMILHQAKLNYAIAEEGVRGNYGASIGKILYRDGSCSVKDRARALAAAGSDARMSGCEMAVCILSGSGNQGICASVPVIAYAKEKNATEEELVRALLVANLITIHQKTGIGCLSAYCGAISAGCGCATGICFLHGGDFYEIAHTLVNAVAILSGTICDGAKPSCAAKIAMAVEAGILGYEMTLAGKQFYSGDGIITKGVENTIRNVGRLARDGMSETDREIIKMMLETK